VHDDTDAAPRRTYDRKPASDRAGKRPAFGSKPSFGSKPYGDKPSFGTKPRFNADRPSFKSDRPAFRRTEGSSDSRPPRREFTPRPYDSGDSSSDRPRKTFSKPGTFGRKREGFAGKPSFSRDNDSRPPRREFTPRPEGDSRDSRPPRRNFADRTGDRPDKPSFSGPRKPGSYAPRPQGGARGFDGDRSSGFAPRKPYAPREGKAGPSRFGSKPGFSRDRESRDNREERGGRASGPPYRKFDAPRTPRTYSSDRPERPARSEGTGSYAGKPKSSFGAKKPYGKTTGGYAGKSGGSFAGKSSSFAGKKPYAKSAPRGTGKPASTFDKFKDNKKPFGKRAPARKFKPEGGE
jgi:hypothetical protein